MKYRSSTDITGHILEITNGANATRTKIMYRTFLSYKQLKEYLILLTGRDLLRYDKHTQTFNITEEGLRSLEAYNQMHDMINTPV